MREAFILMAVLIFSIFAIPSMAGLTMVNEADCSGDCNVKQTYNGESVEVTSSGKTRMETHVEDGKAEMTIDSDGEGEVRMYLNDAGSSNLNVIAADSNEGSAWGQPTVKITSRSRENNSEIIRNWSENLSKPVDSAVNEDFVEDDDSNSSIEPENVTCSGFDYENSCSTGSFLKVSGNKTIEVNNDGNEETIETDGVFQKVYKFFQSFTARIFWG